MYINILYCFISKGNPIPNVLWGKLFYWLVFVPSKCSLVFRCFVLEIKVRMSSTTGKQSNNTGQDDEGEEEDDEVGDLVSAINYNTINYNTISSMAVLKEILGKNNKFNLNIDIISWSFYLLVWWPCVLVLVY